MEMYSIKQISSSMHGFMESADSKREFADINVIIYAFLLKVAPYFKMFSSFFHPDILPFLEMLF